MSYGQVDGMWFWYGQKEGKTPKSGVWEGKEVFSELFGRMANSMANSMAYLDVLREFTRHTKSRDEDTDIDIHPFTSRSQSSLNKFISETTISMIETEDETLSRTFPDGRVRELITV
jgi:hypothetical protein